MSLVSEDMKKKPLWNTKVTKIPVLSCLVLKRKECFFSTHHSTLHTLCLWVIDLRKIPTIRTPRSNGCHQNERVSSKVKKPMSIIWKGSRKWASSKVKKQMGLIEREGSELVSSGVYGYHQKWAWWGLTQFNDTYKLHWSNLLQLRVNKTFRSFSVVFFSLAVSMS
jgi:hypothetical protein